MTDETRKDQKDELTEKDLDQASGGHPGQSEGRDITEGRGKTEGRGITEGRGKTEGRR